jgi:uncharacterized protein YaaN involved in tellurite resistance
VSDNPVPTATTEPSVNNSLQRVDVMPASAGELVSLRADAGLPPSKVSPERARELAAQIDLHNTQSVITFGVEGQKKATSVADQMLQGVRTKDTGPIGNELNTMVHEMRGLDFGQIKTGQKPGFFAKLLGKASSLTLFLEKYETVESKIAAAQNNLDGHRVGLMRDIKMLDNLYASSLEMLNSLDESIAAVEYKINEVNTVDIPALQETANKTNDPADVQAVADLAEARDGLERRLADLRLTRMITIQSLPQIRIIQNNDEGLAEKIQTQILNVLPIWKRNMAVAVAAWRAEAAGKQTKAATDFTNQLIEGSAAQLQQSNKAIRTELERGIVDVASIQKANDSLIQTINDTLDLAEQGKAARAQAEKDLADAESKLKQALIAGADRQAKMRGTSRS